MRWLGIIMAAFGGTAAVFMLLIGGGQAILPIVVWGAVCIVGIIILVKHRRKKWQDQASVREFKFTDTPEKPEGEREGEE